MTQPTKKENKENKENKTDKKNKKDTGKKTSDQQSEKIETKRNECSGKGHQHESNICPLGNMVSNTSLATNKTPDMEVDIHEEMDGIIEATNKRKKTPDSDNERSPDRDMKEAGKKVKKLIQDSKEMNDGEDEYDKEEGEIV